MSTELSPFSLESENDPPAISRTSGWKRLLNSNRVIWVMAAVAIVSLLAGVMLSRFIVSPSQAAQNATAPDAGLITVPVENRELANDVTLRGDANFADSVEVALETGDIGGPAVVTGQVPTAGANLDALAVALEVAGRPVIVLPGDLPVYRTLRIGVAGPDVVQLKQALRAVGIDGGNPESNVFDSATAAGIAALYNAVGYPAPDSPEGTAESVRSAEDSVRSADEQVAAAQRELSATSSGAPESVRLAQNNLVRQADVALKAAQNAVPLDPAEVADRAADYDIAVAARAEALAIPDAGAAVAALNAARAGAASARALLTETRSGTLSYLPSSEVLYLSGLPRRVDEVMVTRGSAVGASIMRVSGSSLVIAASAAESDAKLLAVGARAVISMPDDSEIEATVTKVEPRDDGKAQEGVRYDVVLTPDALTPEQLQILQGNNVRVQIPVSSTEGKVLAVPLAALTAGAGGESRIEVSEEDGKTRLIEVTTGLAAEGYVEIIPVEGRLDAGALVVVGR